MLVETDGETVFSSRGALIQEWKSLQSAVRDRFWQYAGTISNGAQGFLASPENPAKAFVGRIKICSRELG
jgi:biotin/methionine sulfoxide reductase